MAAGGHAQTEDTRPLRARRIEVGAAPAAEPDDALVAALGRLDVLRWTARNEAEIVLGDGHVGTAGHPLAIGAVASAEGVLEYFVLSSGLVPSVSSTISQKFPAPWAKGNFHAPMVKSGIFGLPYGSGYEEKK